MIGFACFYVIFGLLIALGMMSAIADYNEPVFENTRDWWMTFTLCVLLWPIVLMFRSA